MASDIDLNALMSSLSWWETAGYIGLAAVLVGVIGESIHEFAAWPRHSVWRSKGGRLSSLILIVGLAIEGVAQVNANNKSAGVIAFLGSQEASAREEAAKANERAAQIYAEFAARSLTVEQRQELADKIREKNFRIDLRYAPTSESVAYGMMFGEAFRAANKSAGQGTIGQPTLWIEGIELADDGREKWRPPHPGTPLGDLWAILTEFCDVSTMRVVDWRQIPSRDPFPAAIQPPAQDVVLMFVGTKPVPPPPAQ